MLGLAHTVVCEENKKQEAPSLWQIFVDGALKMLTEGTANHFYKEAQAIQNNLDGDLVGRIRASSFREQ